MSSKSKTISGSSIVQHQNQLCLRSRLSSGLWISAIILFPVLVQLVEKQPKPALLLVHVVLRSPWLSKASARKRSPGSGLPTGEGHCFYSSSSALRSKWLHCLSCPHAPQDFSISECKASSKFSLLRDILNLCSKLYKKCCWSLQALNQAGIVPVMNIFKIF